MAKFNITVDLDWIDEEFNLDEEIKNIIINGVVEKVQQRLTEQVENECNNRINSQLASIEKSVSDKLNGIMDAFFDEPRDITDKYGDVIKKGVTVRETLKTACDEFITQPLDQNGIPTKSGWDVKYKTRVDYIVAKSIDWKMESAIKSAVDEITKNLKQRITEEVKKQLGDKIGEVLEIDKLFPKTK